MMSYSWGAGHDPAATAAQPAVRLAYDSTSAVGARDRSVPAAPPAGTLPRLAAELSPMVDVWQRLLVVHQPDRAGRCRTCTKGGTGLPATPWPCSIHGIADLARRWHAGERTA